jgi:uncharacterized repeat protein (TIGR03803 family)
MKINRLRFPAWMLFALPLVTCLWCNNLAAQNPIVTVKTLYSFTGGADGSFPYGGLTVGNDGNFYGTTAEGGTNGGYGTVFKITTNGAFNSLTSFNFTDGSEPTGALTLGHDGNFFGAADDTVFKVTTNGGLTSLTSINGTNGDGLWAGLTPGNDGNLYGAAELGGTSAHSSGTVFKVTTNGVLQWAASFNDTNGANPQASLTPGTDSNFYGTTTGGGTNGDYGTVFKVTTNGALTSLVSFNGTNGSASYGVLALGGDGNFYGTTHYGGTNGGSGTPTSGYGTVFKITTNGVLTSLVSFNGTNGSYPYAGLTLGSDGNFYGTTTEGGTNGGYGTVFKVTTNGAITALVSFNYTNGYRSWPALTVGNDGNFYGTTEEGGTNGGYGTVYVLVFHPNIYAITAGINGVTLDVAARGKSTNRVWASTSVKVPVAQWQVISTNVADVNGLFQFTDTNIACCVSKFYRVSTP